MKESFVAEVLDGIRRRDRVCLSIRSAGKRITEVALKVRDVAEREDVRGSGDRSNDYPIPASTNALGGDWASELRLRVLHTTQ
jgi:hypothetical protein